MATDEELNCESDCVCVRVCVRVTSRRESDDTWAQGYVAKLSLGLGSVTGPASVLGRGTHPSPSAVTSATRERAQAPRRPLLPHTVHCGHREGVRPDPRLCLPLHEAPNNRLQFLP